MLVAASAAGAVFAGPHADARAADPFVRPAVVATHAAPVLTGPSTSPDPGRPVRAIPRDPAPVGVGPQVAPHAPVVAEHPVPAAVAVALPAYGEGAPLAVHAVVPDGLAARAAPRPPALRLDHPDRLAFDRSLTWTGAGTLMASLTGLFIVGRRRRTW